MQITDGMPNVKQEIAVFGRAVFVTGTKRQCRMTIGRDGADRLSKIRRHDDALRCISEYRECPSQRVTGAGDIPDKPPSRSMP